MVGEVKRLNSLRHVARLIGIPVSTLRSFLDGVESRGERLEKIRRYVAGIETRENERRTSDSGAHETPLPATLSVGERSALWALYSVQEHVNQEIRRVLLGDVPELRGGLRDDALAAGAGEAVEAHRRTREGGARDTDAEPGEPQQRPA